MRIADFVGPTGGSPSQGSVPAAAASMADTSSFTMSIITANARAAAYGSMLRKKLPP